MTCAGNNTVAALLAGAIDATAAHELEVHLDACASCRQLVADLGRGLSALGGVSRDARGGEGLPKVGEQVGRYTIKRVVGVGGMGVVYEAHDAALDRRVAVKLLRPDLVDDAQLLVEAQAMARLQHANIAVIHDVGWFRGQLYLCMEYVDGATLRAWLAERSRGWREIVATFVAAGRGLAYVHAAGLVHLDFKPDNVLVSRGTDGGRGAHRRVVVTDFGLARMVGAHHTPHLAVGTPAYMAPEQKRGAATDQRTDQYGFCAALREAVGDAGPAWLRRVLARGLAEHPVDRYASMAALLAALEAPTHRTRRYVAAALVTAGAALGLAALPGPQTIREVVDHPPVIRVIRQPGEAAEAATVTPDEDRDDDAIATVEPTAASPAAELAEVVAHPAAKVALPLLALSEDAEAIAQTARARRSDAPPEVGHAGLFGPSCSDGTDRVCAIDQPSCPPTTVAAILDGCWTCADVRTCAPLGLPHSCDDGTHVTAATAPTCTGHLVASVHRGSLQCADPFACARPSLPQQPSKPHGKASPVCGNFVCEGGENRLSCPSDCLTTCGNGACEIGEDSSSCPSDCCQLAQGSGSGGANGGGSGASGSGDSSGAGSGGSGGANGGTNPNGGGSGGPNICFDATGNQVSCDAGSGSSNGGNGGGSGSGGSCVPVCGNNFCEGGEDSVSCPQDCGGCDPTTNNC